MCVCVRHLALLKALKGPSEACLGPIGDPPKNSKIYKKPTNNHPHPPPKNPKLRGTSGTSDSQFKKSCFDGLAVLKAKIKIKNHRILGGIGPQPTIALGKW